MYTPIVEKAVHDTIMKMDLFKLKEQPLMPDTTIAFNFKKLATPTTISKAVEVGDNNRAPPGRTLFLSAIPKCPLGYKDYWKIWFHPFPGTTLFKPLRKFQPLELQFGKNEMKRYREIKRFGAIFEQFTSLVEFEKSYAGHLRSIPVLRKEIRLRNPSV